ncbi:MAG: cytochrome c biogenesis protein CcdA [Nitrospirota bacterium]
MESGQNISLLLAFSAGLFSFLSPCVLPLVPSYVSYITGLSFEDLTNKTERTDILKTTVFNSLLFILGFSVVFISLGASASYIGKLMVSYQEIIRKVGGVIIIIFGLFIMGILKMNFLQVEKKMHIKSKPAGYIGSFLVGIGFAAGWTPCVGPILGSILLFASTSGSVATGIKLLTIYSIGLALPLFISALAINSFLSYFKKFHKYIRIITIASGLLLVFLGILIYTNSLSLITFYLYKFGIGWDVYI